MLKYRQSDLARTIPTAYRVEAPPRIEVLDAVDQGADSGLGSR